MIKRDNTIVTEAKTATDGKIAGFSVNIEGQSLIVDVLWGDKDQDGNFTGKQTQQVGFNQAEFQKIITANPDLYNIIKTVLWEALVLKGIAKGTIS